MGKLKRRVGIIASTVGAAREGVGDVGNRVDRVESLLIDIRQDVNRLATLDDVRQLKIVVSARDSESAKHSSRRMPPITALYTCPV